MSQLLGVTCHMGSHAYIINIVFHVSSESFLCNNVHEFYARNFGKFIVLISSVCVTALSIAHCMCWSVSVCLSVCLGLLQLYVTNLEPWSILLSRSGF